MKPETEIRPRIFEKTLLEIENSKVKKPFVSTTSWQEQEKIKELYPVKLKGQMSGFLIDQKA